MAKADKSSEKNGNTKFHDYKAPEEGFKDRNDDGYIWNPEDGPIFFIPQSARLVDSKLRDDQYSILVHGTLCQKTILRDRNDNEVEGKEGDPVVVWISGGNRKLLQWCGTKVFMFATGEEIETKKGQNPMKVFKIQTASEERKMIPLEADFRKISRDLNTPWDNIKTRTGKDARNLSSEDLEELGDIPF